MALRDLFVRFRVDVAGQEKLDNLDKGLKAAKDRSEELGDQLRFLGRVFVTGFIARGIKTFVADLVQQADALKHSAETLGLSTDELQKYQYVSSLMQVPVQQAAVALRFFNRAAGEAAFGTKSAVKVFGQLGVSVRDAHGEVKPTDALLFEVADKLKGVKSQAERTAIAMRLLGRGGAAMLPVLQNGSAALREMFADVEELGGGFGEDFIEKAHDVDRESKRLAMGWRTMAALLGKALLPVLKRWLENGIKNVKSLIDLAKSTDVLHHGLQFLTVVLGAVAAAWLVMNAAMLPELALWALLAGSVYFLFGLFDDFATFMSGGKSVIGMMLDQMGGAGAAKKAVEDISRAIDAIKEAIGAATEGGKTFGQVLSDVLVGSLPNMIKWGSHFILAVVKTIDSALTGLYQLGQLLALVLPKAWGGSTLEDIDKTNAAWEKRMKAVTQLEDALDNMGKPPAAVGPPVPPAGGPSPGAGYTSAEMDVAGNLAGRPPPASYADPLNYANITNNITVHGNADPKAIGDAAGNASAKALADAKFFADREAAQRNTYNAVGAGLPDQD